MTTPQLTPSAVPAQAKSSSAGIAFSLCCLVCFLLSACGCVREDQNSKEKPPAIQKEEAPAPESAKLSPDLERRIDPSPLKLSPEAEHLYYHLLLADGIAENSAPVVKRAITGLMKLDKSLGIYQNASTALLSRGDFASVIRVAQEGLERYPGDKKLTLILAGAYNESDEVQKAITLLEAFHANHPKEQDVAEGLASLYLKSGQQQKASQILSSIPREPHNIDSELFRAGVLTTTGKNQEARKILEQLLKKDPENFEAWLELAYIAEQQDDVSTAVKGYEKAASLLPVANPEISFRLASLYIKQQNPEKALETLGSDQADAPAYAQLAFRLSDSKFYAEAETALSKSAALGGNIDEIALVRSMIRQEAGGNPKSGLAPLSVITESSPFYGAALLQRARIYIDSEDYNKAYKAASEGRKKYPDKKELWGLEAYSLVKLNKGEEAEKLIKERLEQTPDDEDFLYSLGTVQDEMGKRSEALQTMEKILYTNPGNYHALNYIGYTLADENKDLERAHSLIRSALEIRPDASYIVDSLAWAQYRLGKFDEAWKSIQRCISLGGDEATIWEHYGDIALAVGKKDEAIKGYTEAIERKPKNIEDVQKKLINLGQ